MPQAPDTLIVTGPNFEQDPLDYALVTPTGGIQMKLRDALAFGANLSIPPPIGNTIPNTGSFTTLSATGKVTALQYVTGNNLQAPANSALTPLVSTIAHLSGTVGAGAFNGLNSFVISSDTADVSAGTDNAAKLIDVVWNFSGAANGARAGVWSTLNPMNLTNAIDTICLYGAITANSEMAGSFLQPLATAVTAGASATNIGSTVNEFDYSALSHSVGIKGGVQITLSRGDTYQGLTDDAGLFFTNSNYAGVSPGMDNMISAGGTGQGWPISPTSGTLLGITPQTVDQGTNASVRFIPRTGKAGIDLGLMNLTAQSGYSFLSPAYAVDGTGQIRWGAATLGVTSSGVSIDATRNTVTAIAVNSPGTPVNTGIGSYHPTEILNGLPTPSNGQYAIATTKVVNAAVASGGSGGTNGAVTLTDASGAAGTPFTLTGTISGGALTGALTVATAGSYTTENPSGVSSIASVPVTGGGLIGARVTLGMGVATATILVPDTSSSTPASITAVGGSGIGATLTPTWTLTNTLSLNPSGGPIKTALLTNAANDAAAAAAGVAVSQFYRNGSIVMQRVS